MNFLFLEIVSGKNTIKYVHVECGGIALILVKEKV